MISQLCSSYSVDTIAGQAFPQSLFHVAKAKDPSLQMTEDEFNQLNIGLCLEEAEREKLGDLLRKYCEIFAFTPGE